MSVMACWPEEKKIPVLSKFVVDILLKKDNIEIGEEGGKIPFNGYGEDILRLKHNKNFYEIPKILTSKGTLHFLGFRPSDVEVLWQYIINRRSPSNEPIAPFRAYRFWIGVNEYLNIKFRTLFERNKYIQVMSTKHMLDTIGLRNDVQIQTLKITYEGRGPFYISLQNQNPRSVLEWVKRYIHHRWSMLADLETLISSRPGDGWLLDIVREFNEKPLDSNTAYTIDYYSEPQLDMDATPQIKPPIPNKEKSEKEFADNEVSGDLFNW